MTPVPTSMFGQSDAPGGELPVDVCLDRVWLRGPQSHASRRDVSHAPSVQCPTRRVGSQVAPCTDLKLAAVHGAAEPSPDCATGACVRVPLVSGAPRRHRVRRRIATGTADREATRQLLDQVVPDPDSFGLGFPRGNVRSGDGGTREEAAPLAGRGRDRCHSRRPRSVGTAFDRVPSRALRSRAGGPEWRAWVTGSITRRASGAPLAVSRRESANSSKVIVPHFQVLTSQDRSWSVFERCR